MGYVLLPFETVALFPNLTQRWPIMSRFISTRMGIKFLEAVPGFIPDYVHAAQIEFQCFFHAIN